MIYFFEMRNINFSKFFQKHETLSTKYTFFRWNARSLWSSVSYWRYILFKIKSHKKLSCHGNNRVYIETRKKSSLAKFTEATPKLVFFFCQGFLSQTFPNHRTEGISRAITAESSPLHIGRSRNQIGNFWFPSASH